MLSEWLSEQESSVWQPPRWDTNYVYFDGKSSMTYEYDAVAASAGTGASIPPGPTMTQPTLIGTPKFTWLGDDQQTYDLELQDEFNQVKGFYRQISGSDFLAPPLLKAGKYRARVRVSDQVWGPWQSTWFIPTSVRDLAADYNFNLQGVDQSYFDNHLDATALQFGQGLERESLTMSLGDVVTIPTPHAFSTAQDGSVAFWIKLPPPSGFEPQDYDQLWQFGALKLLINQAQVPQLLWTGGSYQMASSALPRVAGTI